MKLFTRYNRINLLVTVFMLLLAMVAFYFLLRYVLVNQVDEDLEIEQAQIRTYVARYQTLPEMMPVKDQDVIYMPVVTPVASNIYKTIRQKVGEEDQRQLVFGITVSGQSYNIIINKSLEGTDHLTQSVATIALVTILFILAISVFVNRLVLRRLWQPFYRTMFIMQHFQLGKQQQLDFIPTQTDEFELMNATLLQTTQKAEKDYFLLKEFTENASHELQTPLAIIRSKLELLMQESLSETQSMALQSADEAIQKLSRFNRSLLLLAKIQNNQFADTVMIDLKKVIEKNIEAFEELCKAKNITINTELESKRLMLNTDLAEILIKNFLNNAIKHNTTDGKISILLTDNQLSFSNTGSQQEIDQTRLYTRFYNPGRSANSTGLGLSIVKQICDVSHFTIGYQFRNGWHRFLVDF